MLEKLGLRPLPKMTRKDWLLLGLVLLFALFIRGWRLNYPDRQYFDECYYVPGGISYLEGTTDKNSVHPPLAKIQIAVGMAAGKGLNRIGIPVSEETGWRITSLVLGVGFVGLTYILGYRLTGKAEAALLAAFFTAIDFMAFVLSRICFLDMVVAFWMVFGALFAWLYIEAESNECRKSLLWGFLSAVCFGISASCKWNGLFGGVTAFALMIALPEVLKGDKLILKNFKINFKKAYLRRFISLALLFAVCIPCVYAASYGPRFVREGFSKRIVTRIYKEHVRMVKFRYDSKQFKHRYSSKFYKWPLSSRPVWFHFKKFTYDNTKYAAAIVCMGCIAFNFPALTFLAELLYLGISRNKAVYLFISCCWLGQWLFWGINKGFIYYIVPGVPFLACTMAIVVNDWAKEKQKGFKAAACIYIMLLALLFALYYPFLTACPVKMKMFGYLFPAWIPGWR